MTSRKAQLIALPRSLPRAARERTLPPPLSLGRPLLPSPPPADVTGRSPRSSAAAGSSSPPAWAGATRAVHSGGSSTRSSRGSGGGGRGRAAARRGRARHGLRRGSPRLAAGARGGGGSIPFLLCISAAPGGTVAL